MTYLEELAKTTKEPIYYIEVWNRDETQVVQRYGSRTALGFEVMAGGLLPPKANLQKVDGSKGTVTVGTMSFEVLNVEQIYPNKSITELISIYPLVGNFIELYGGFSTLHYTDYVRLFKGEVVSVDVNRTATGMILKVHDLTNLMNREVLTLNKDNTALTDPLGTGGILLADVEDASGWPESGYVRMEEEIIKYYSRTDVRLWIALEGIDSKITGRGIYNTLRDVLHVAGTPVFRVDVYEKHPVDMVLNLLITTEDGNNGPYDLGLADFGLGVNQFDIDVDSFLWVRDKLSAGASIRLLIDAEEVIERPWIAQEVINEWILYPIGCYLTVTWEGKIALRMISASQFPSGPTPFVDRNLIGNLSCKRTAKSIYNNTTYMFNYHPGTGELLTISGIRMQGATGIYGSNTPLAKYSTRAYHSDFDASRLFYAHLKRRYEHSINPTSSIKGKSTFTQLDVNLGEVVTLNTQRLPAIQIGNGGWGITGKVQVLSRQPNYSKGVIDWAFLFLDDVKELVRSESYITRTPDDGVITWKQDTNNPVVEPEDGYYDSIAGEESNFVMLQFQFTTGTDPYARDVFLNLTLWVLSQVDDNYIRYDFTLRYVPDSTLQNFYKWFIIPYGAYKYKVDYWQANATEAFGVYRPDDITWPQIRLYKLDYVVG